MYLRELILKNFRNFRNLSLQFYKNINVFLGDNSEGKTNLLESIYFLSALRSPKANKEQEVILFGEEYAKIEGRIKKEEWEKTLSVNIFPSYKVVKIDNRKINKLKDALGELLCVSFSSFDLEIFAEPEKRRRFLNLEIPQLKPIYVFFLQNYNKALFQRNRMLSLIKKGEGKIDDLEVFEEAIAKYGLEIIKLRKEFLGMMEEKFREIYNRITGKDKIEIIYLPSFSFEWTKEDFLKKFKEIRQREIALEQTLIGPHRDDLKLQINGIDLKTYGSSGEKRAVCLSLKLAEIEVIIVEKGEYPVFLLDDLSSELDDKRQKFILDFISKKEKIQVFITTTDVSKMNYLKDKDIFNIEDGGIKKIG